MTKLSILVRAIWDEEAGVWVATSEDVPGLVAEAETTQALEEKLECLIPILLEENGRLPKQTAEVPLFILHERTTKVLLKA